MPGQHLAAVRVELAKRDRLKTTRPLEPERKPAYSREQVENTQHPSLPPSGHPLGVHCSLEPRPLLGREHR